MSNILEKESQEICDEMYAYIKQNGAIREQEVKLKEEDWRTGVNIISRKLKVDDN